MKKTELMASTLQTLIRSALKEKSEKPHNGGREDDKKKKEKGEKALLKPTHE